MKARLETATTLHRGRVFHLRAERHLLEDGRRLAIDAVRHPGAAAIVPLTSDRRVLLLRQFRCVINATIWEIPAGTLEPGEEPLAAARRELVEETGHAAANWESLGAITPVPSYSDEVIHLYLAWDLRPAAGRLDPDEILEVQAVDWSEALAMIARGEIRDAKTITGLLLAERHSLIGEVF
jgi:ADP-ribose pyrophosphatase